MRKLDRVLKYLKDNGSGSKLTIRTATNYDNVGDAIFRLRNRGHIIDRIWQYTKNNAKYAVYIYKGFKKIDH